MTRSGLGSEFGRLANERGRRNEAKALRACSEKMPVWILAVRAATPEEDSRGIDLVFDSDMGKLFLQVKSSREGVESFERKRRSALIGTLLVRGREPDHQIRALAVQRLTELRNEIQKHRLTDEEAP